MINTRPIFLAASGFFLLLLIQTIVIAVVIKAVGDKIPPTDPIVDQLAKLNYNMYQLYTQGVNKHLASMACSFSSGWNNIGNCTCLQEAYCPSTPDFTRV